MTIFILTALVWLVVGFFFGMYTCWVREKSAITRANERIKLAIKDCEDFKKIAQECIEDAKKEVVEYVKIIEKQIHMIEFLKMKLRDK